MNRRDLIKNLALSVPALSVANNAAAQLFAALPPTDEKILTGKFAPSWESLKQYQTPDWFKNAKFGMWAHWGPQCEPAWGDWYARRMYNEGSDAYKWHLKKYGHPSKFGFKDVINEWKADKFDPEALVSLYKKAGAKYFVALANHHDNFDNFKSKHHAWNSTKIGPKKDLIKGWEKAAHKHGLHFGVSVHASHAWTWYETSQGADKKGEFANIPYDGNSTAKDGKGKWWDGLDPQELYVQNHPLSVDNPANKGSYKHWKWNTGANKPTEAHLRKYRNRLIQLIDDYNPDLIYFDDNVLPFNYISDVGLEIISHFYNTSLKRNGGKMQAIVNTKELDEAQRQCVVWDIERGVSNNIETFNWQVDTCIGGWHYNQGIYDKNEYKSAKTVIHMLIDVVSKNGNLLLNIPVRGDGTIDEKAQKIVEDITTWMQQYSECIYDTKPWKKYAEGPALEGLAKLEGHGFNEGKGKPFTGEDIRFTVKGDTLFAMPLGAPTNNKVVIKSLSQGNELYPKEIQKVSLVNTKESLRFTRDSNGLTVNLPDNVNNAFAYALAIQ